MHPAVLEVNLHTVNGAHLAVLFGTVFLGDFLQQGIHVHAGRQVLAVLADDVVGIGLAQLAHLHAFLGQQGEEEGHTHQGIATVVQFGIDDAAVTLASDDGMVLAHQGGDVHFAHGRSLILAAAVLVGHVTQGAGGGHVGDGVARGVLQHIVCHTHQGVFLAKHLAGFAHQGQTVHIGVNHDAEVAVLAGHRVGNLGKVFRNGLGIMGKMACGFAVQLHHILHAQGAKQAGDGNAARGVNGIHCHAEIGLGNGLFVYQFEPEHALYVMVDGVQVFGHLAQLVHLGVAEVLAFGQGYHLVALGGIDKFATGVQQLQGIPMFRVVGGGDDDAAIGMTVYHGHLRRRRGGEAGFYHVDTHALQGAHHQTVHHSPGEACVAAHHQGEAFAALVATL